MNDDTLLTRADLIAAAHGRHVARIAGVRRAIDAEAKRLDPLAPVPLIDEPLYDVKPEALAARPAAIRADAASLAREIVAAIREGLAVRSLALIGGDIAFDEWAIERSANIAVALLGNYRIERLP